jgi:urease accessory protein
MGGVLQGIADGFLDPILLLEHALTLVALGLLVGRQQGRSVTLSVFAAALALGLIALAFAVGQTPARNVLLADAALIGMLVAAAWTPPRAVTLLLAGVAGFALGLDSPPQAISIAEANATLVGTALGACAVLLVVAFCAGHAQQWWQQVGVRILGSWIAASAILVLAVLLR